MNAAQYAAIKADPERWRAHQKMAAAATKKYRATERGRATHRRASAAYHRRLVLAGRAARAQVQAQETATP